MFSRNSTIVLSNIYEQRFRKYRLNNNRRTYYNDLDELYDFLFMNNYPAWFCNKAKLLKKFESRQIKEFVMRLHTGESQLSATENWSWEQRRELGQSYLRNLAEDILAQGNHSNLINSLELDGFVLKNGQLHCTEVEVLDSKEMSGVLEDMYNSLGLGNRETALHHLTLSTEHYISDRWDDSISNSRKFLECVLREVASLHSQIKHCKELSAKVYESPKKVRDYLEKEGLLETKEKKAIASVYGLLSNTGSHPYIADNDQARLLRHLSLTFSQFVLLRLEGFNASISEE